MFVIYINLFIQSSTLAGLLIIAFPYRGDDIDIIDAKAAITDVVASWDPNEMVGPQGVGEEHYIGPTTTITYRILFENKAEAGDAAYRVRISDELDESVFDISAVRFGETSHNGVGYNWEMKREGNKLSWDIKGIELPPNINAPEGEGFVTFSVDLKPGLADGTRINNQATIIFDKNFPIETNVFTNTLDLTPPTTLMSEVTCKYEESIVTVNCQSVDAASGVDSYLLFVSKDGSDYTYEGQYYQGTINFPVAADCDYSFYVLAVDAVGNVERIAPQALSIQTDIATVPVARTKTMEVYTLDGRKFKSVKANELSNLPRGIYIINGHKVLVK